MKATGEVMAISDSFESALMKAVRGAEISADTLHLKKMEEVADEDLMERCVTPTDERLFYVAEAIRRGVEIEKINAETKIDMWFLSKIKNLVDFEKAIAGKELTFDEYVKAKKYGFTDKAIARITGKAVTHKLKPTFKMVDTCAGEFEAHTPTSTQHSTDLRKAARMKPTSRRQATRTSRLSSYSVQARSESARESSSTTQQFTAYTRSAT